MYTMDDDSTAMKHAVVNGIGFGPRVSKMSVGIGEPRQRLGNGLIAARSARLNISWLPPVRSVEA
jgi:hypothetical protein